MKNYKKVVSAVAAVSMLASTAVVPMSASADTAIAVEGGKATVGNNGAGTAIVASYDDSGRLEKIETKNIADGETAEFNVETGNKVMYWDGLGTMKAVADAVTVTEDMMATATPDVEVTATPDVEVTATPDAGDDDVAVIQSWKFDFGSAEDVADGYTAVTPDRDYMVTGDYGFLGLTEDDYKVGNRYDGFGLQKGQKITLAAGGGTGLYDGIGSVGEDDFGNAGDKYYPTRFALKADDETYYRVKATVTTLDPTKDATASLYTERKHPIYTEKTIKAGETVTSEFTIRVTPIYYQKSEPSGTIADGMVNVAVLGENTALASLEIDQIESATTVWVLGDSTVTDGNCNLPFWPLQNYTGVGTGLTKYLPSNVAMVNEGEGGLAANDNYHFNMVKNRIKAGDFLYLEYGHNHKSDGVTGYLGDLTKYYDACHSVGATLVIVGPIDRHNTGQYDSATNTWSSTLNGFSKGGKYYVDVMRTGGYDKAKEFVTKAQSDINEAYAWADEIIAAGVSENGVTDATFVDLNQPSLDWLTTISARGIVNDTEVTNSQALTNYYFQTGYGSTGTDGTHPNDTGAENLAYFFFTTADLDAYPELAPLMTNFAEGATHEVPTPVSPEVINLGYPANSAWPKYIVPSDNPYPIVIKDIVVEDGAVKSAEVEVLANSVVPMTAYGIIAVTVYDANGEEVGTIYALDQVDNSTGAGPQTITSFTNDVKIEDGYTYSARIWQALDTEGGIKVDPENIAYSAVYTPTDIETYILVGEDSDVENFSYYGATTLTDTSNWVFGGSSGYDLTLGKDDNGVTYTTIASTGSGRSWFLMRPLDNIENGTGNTGRYVISADMIYENGSGLTVALAKSTTPTKSPFVSDSFALFTIGSNGVVTVDGTEVGTISATSWTNLKYVLDMSAGTIEVSVGGSDPVVLNSSYYQSFTTPTLDTMKHFVMSGAREATFGIKMSNLTVGKLKDNGATSTLTAAVAADSEGMGSVYTTEEGTTSVTVSKSATATATAVAADGYVFTGWYSDGTIFSEDETVSLRLYKDVNLEATFAKQAGVEGVTNFAVNADKALVKAGGTATLSTVDVVDKAGNEVAYTAADVTWATNASGVNVDGGVVTLADDFVIGENTTTDIDVTATINNITKTYTLTVYSYEFYENVTGGAVSSGTWDGNTTEVAGKNIIVFPGGNGTFTYTLGEAVALDGTTTLSYQAGAAGSNTCGQPRYIEIYDSNGNKVVNEVLGYSWGSFVVGGTIGKDSISNGVTYANAAVVGSVTDTVEITINTDGTGKVTMGGVSADITVNTAATDIVSIKLMSKSGAPDYTARALGMTEIKITK